MNIRTIGLAAVAALSLGVGTALAQEGANDTVSGQAYFPASSVAAPVAAPAARPNVVQSGSSDVDPRTVAPNWLPGSPYGVLAGGG